MHGALPDAWRTPICERSSRQRADSQATACASIACPSSDSQSSRVRGRGDRVSAPSVTYSSLRREALACPSARRLGLPCPVADAVSPTAKTLHRWLTRGSSRQPAAWQPRGRARGDPRHDLQCTHLSSHPARPTIMGRCGNLFICTSSAKGTWAGTHAELKPVDVRYGTTHRSYYTKFRYSLSLCTVVALYSI